jgi:hypothetical protein
LNYPATWPEALIAGMIAAITVGVLFIERHLVKIAADLHAIRTKADKVRLDSIMYHLKNRP